jgi:hypothetical protein
MGSRNRYGSIGEHGEWKNAVEHYHWDRLQQAYDLSLELGVGATGVYGRFFRQIEAEHLTRLQSELQKSTDWLTLESIRHETDHVPQWQEVVLDACANIAGRLGWEHGAPTMISVLAAESDAPWAVGRYGYCVDKFPYDKICLPQVSLTNGQLEETVVHEYAHVITLNLSEGLVPRYLDEAIAMVAQGEPDYRVLRGFASDQIRWLAVEDINATYVQEMQAGGGQQLWFAYQQSAAIGHYLVSLKGEAGLGDLLRAFSDNSTLTELKMRIVGQSPADEALQQVYGFGERELFERALRWTRGDA